MLKEGDYVRVVKEHRGARADSVWEIEQTFEDEGQTYYVGNNTNGQQSGYDLDADKVEKITQDIPFRIGATLEVEVIATIYASSYDEAVAWAKKYPNALLDDYDEMDVEVATLWTRDF